MFLVYKWLLFVYNFTLFKTYFWSFLFFYNVAPLNHVLVNSLTSWSLNYHFLREKKKKTNWPEELNGKPGTVAYLTWNYRQKDQNLTNSLGYLERTYLKGKLNKT